MDEHAQDEFTAMPAGGPDVVNAEIVAGDVPADSFERPVVMGEDSILAELEKIRSPKGSWVQTVVILAVSLALFVGLGMRDNPIAFTAMLVGVLFIHEMGHYVGMRIFGYRNVRMFFIPMFGAAVSGQRTSAKSYQEAIVTLLGPLPGLFLAVALMVGAFVPGIDPKIRHYLVWAALLFGMLNGFNLLPIFPFDGGRLLNQILFSRNRYLEGVFLIVAAIALIVLGIGPAGRVFLFLGIWMLMTVGTTFRMNSIAQRVGRQFVGQLTPMDGPIPRAIFRAIVGEVRAAFPSLKAPKPIAGWVFRVWEKMHVRPPGTGATVALLVTYVLALLLTIPWLIPFFMHTAKP